MLSLPERLTHAEAGACARALAAELATRGAATPAGGTAGAADAVVADASALQHFDSSALAVLLDLRRAAQRQGVTLTVQGLPERLRVLAGLYGVAELLPAA